MDFSREAISGTKCGLALLELTFQIEQKLQGDIFDIPRRSTLAPSSIPIGQTF